MQHLQAQVIFSTAVVLRSAKFGEIVAMVILSLYMRFVFTVMFIKRNESSKIPLVSPAMQQPAMQHSIDAHLILLPWTRKKKLRPLYNTI